MSDAPGSAHIRELLPELAAGVATGEERGAALRHLAGCADCRLELDAFARTVDDLLLLAPEVEPPAGFESAVLARIAPAADGPTVRPAPRRRPGAVLRRWSLRVAALGAAAALAAGVVWWQTAPDRHLADGYRRTLNVAHGSYLTAGPLTVSSSTWGTGYGRRAGTVFAYQGDPSWIVVTVNGAPVSGAYRVVVVTRDGAEHMLGTVRVEAGAASYGETVRVPVSTIGSVRLTRPYAPTLTAALKY
jgi:hypothetical protein